jgi:hypothetical protein
MPPNSPKMPDRDLEQIKIWIDLFISLELPWMDISSIKALILPPLMQFSWLITICMSSCCPAKYNIELDGAPWCDPIVDKVVWTSPLSLCIKEISRLIVNA